MSETMELFVDCRLFLGEGPIWHPDREELFWFDILEGVLHRADAGGRLIARHQFDDAASAAAVIDSGRVVVFTAGGLDILTLDSDARDRLIDIEADKPGNRCNDSRVDPSGGFWLGTMSRKGDAEPGVGAVTQYRAGRLTAILNGITIPNSICFSPSGDRAYFADTPTGRILTCPIGADGLPAGPWQLFADTAGHRGHPDGAVVDAEGYLWSARWGGSCVVRHAPDGSIDRVVEVPTSHVSCPAFGGGDLRTLFVTTAREHMDQGQLAREPHAGSVFALRVDVPGQVETRIAL